MAGSVLGLVCGGEYVLDGRKVGRQTKTLGSHAVEYKEDMVISFGLTKRDHKVSLYHSTLSSASFIVFGGAHSGGHQSILPLHPLQSIPNEALHPLIRRHQVLRPPCPCLPRDHAFPHPPEIVHITYAHAKSRTRVGGAVAVAHMSRPLPAVVLEDSDAPLAWPQDLGRRPPRTTRPSTPPSSTYDRQARATNPPIAIRGKHPLVNRTVWRQPVRVRARDLGSDKDKDEESGAAPRSRPAVQHSRTIHKALPYPTYKSTRSSSVSSGSGKPGSSLHAATSASATSEVLFKTVGQVKSKDDTSVYPESGSSESSGSVCAAHRVERM